MLFPGERISKTCFLLTVLIACVVFYAEANDKQINFKIGFDLTQGENGAPSLRVRDFEDSKEINLRAEEKSGEEKKPAARADSDSADSSADSSSKKNRDSSDADAKPAKGSDQSRDDDDDDGDSSNESRGVKLSTKGLSAGDYEPRDADAKIHGRDVDDSGESRRRKREVGRLGRIKRKSKKFWAVRNQDASS